MGTETNVKTKGLDLRCIGDALGFSDDVVTARLADPLSFTLYEISLIEERSGIDAMHLVTDLLSGRTLIWGDS